MEYMNYVETSIYYKMTKHTFTYTKYLNII